MSLEKSNELFLLSEEELSNVVGGDSIFKCKAVGGQQKTTYVLGSCAALASFGLLICKVGKFIYNKVK